MAMQAEAGAKGVEIRFQLGDSPLPARANPEKIQRVLFNLIRNAIRARKCWALLISPRRLAPSDRGMASSICPSASPTTPKATSGSSTPATTGVQKFNSKGEYLSKFGTAGSGSGQLSTLADIAMDPAGSLWVTDV
ncbi:MAG: hypothetical protein WA862_08335 [Solirubrobacterales bacterium]